MADRWSDLRLQVGRLTSCKEDLTAHASQRARLLAARDAALKSTLQADETALTPQRERSRATQLADHIRRRLRRRRKLRKMQFEARLRGVSGMPERTGPSPMQRLRQELHHRQAARRTRAGVTSTEGALDLSAAIEPEHEPMRLLLQRIDSMSTQPDRGDEQTFPGWAAEDLPIFALNNLHAYPDNATFGNYRDIIEDTSRLGASVVRQPGLDLYLDDIFGETTHPVTGFSAPSLPVVSEIWAKLMNFKAKLVKVLVALDHAGQSAIFTLISLAGGGEYTVKIVEGDHDAIVNAIPVVWDAGHEFEEIDGIKWGSGDDLGALDLRSEYQRAYLVRFTSQVCTMLKNIERTYFPEIGIESVIAGLEILNEVDIRNINVTASREIGNEKFGAVAARYTGRNWGTLVYAVAKVVYQSFGERVPVLLPGLASFDVSETLLSKELDGAPRINPLYIHTWNWKQWFFQFFIEKFKEEFNADDTWADRPIGGPSKLATSVDLHFYHKARQKDIEVGPLHVSRVGWQRERMHDILEDKAGGLLSMSETLITNMESGVSAWDTDDFMPAVFSSESERPTWQSWEVWRRLVGGLAAGAYVVGWNTWRSNPGSDRFQGSGLREDAKELSSTGRSTPVAPEDALQRASWFAFRRCASLIKVISRVDMVLPAPPTEGEMVVVDEDSAPIEDVVVIEIAGSLSGGHVGGTYYFGYLIFVDGWRDTEDRFELRATPDWGSGVTARLIAVLPSGFGTTVGSTGELPYNDSAFLLSGLTESTDVAIPTSGKSMHIKLAAGPKLLLTRVALSWTVATA